jgi:hypothetical protein
MVTIVWSYGPAKAQGAGVRFRSSVQVFGSSVRFKRSVQVFGIKRMEQAQAQEQAQEQGYSDEIWSRGLHLLLLLLLSLLSELKPERLN